MESSDPELVSNGVSNSNWGYHTDNFHGFYEPIHIWTVLCMLLVSPVRIFSASTALVTWMELQVCPRAGGRLMKAEFCD